MYFQDVKTLQFQDFLFRFVCTNYYFMAFNIDIQKDCEDKRTMNKRK